MKQYDYLIVGAGLAGAIMARELTKAGKCCLVIEKRSHIGGNVYTERIDGINVHEYGAHIFHTSDKAIWDYVNSFVEFNRYTNCPVAKAPNGKLYNLPFNMNTFYQMWGVKTPAEAEAKLEDQRKEAKQAMADAGITEPRNLEEQALTLVGKDIYEQLIKEYTEKQWGRPCSELPSFIIRRLPVRLTFDNNYFNDTYQGIPVEGYTELVKRMLEGVEVRLNCDYFDYKEELDAIVDKVIYTGEIDRYYGYRFGTLQYRTVSFEVERHEIPNYQGNAVINFTSSNVPYTRIIEHKHFEKFGNEVYDNPITIISKEFSKEWKKGDEPYYPVNNEKNMALYAKYKSLADADEDVIFCGRLADYRYYDMHQVISEALNKVKELIS